jgi:hypothetical protein
VSPMQPRVENGMNASRHQVHGKWVGGEKAGLVLHMGGEPSASVARPLTLLSRQAGREEGHRLVVPHLASFAGAKRAELESLLRAEATAGLRELLTRVTCLASVRPVSARLTVARLVLAQGFSPGRSSRGALVESAPRRDVDLMVDEGGIYSW